MRMMLSTGASHGDKQSVYWRDFKPLVPSLLAKIISNFFFLIEAMHNMQNKSNHTMLNYFVKWLRYDIALFHEYLIRQVPWKGVFKEWRITKWGDNPIYFEIIHCLSWLVWNWPRRVDLLTNHVTNIKPVVIQLSGYLTNKNFVKYTDHVYVTYFFIFYIEWIFTLFFTDVTPKGVTWVITSLGVNIEWTGRDSTRWWVVNFHSTGVRIEWNSLLNEWNFFTP